MYLSEQIESKWAPVLEHADLTPITDPYKKAVTAVVLENQERALREEQGIMEATHANQTGALLTTTTQSSSALSVVRCLT